MPIKYLRKKEWSMGNKQCPDCCGCSPNVGWWTDYVGHMRTCPLAKTLESLGEVVQYKKRNPDRVIGAYVDAGVYVWVRLSSPQVEKDKITERF